MLYDSMSDTTNGCKVKDVTAVKQKYHLVCQHCSLPVPISYAKLCCCLDNNRILFPLIWICHQISWALFWSELQSSRKFQENQPGRFCVTFPTSNEPAPLLTVIYTVYLPCVSATRTSKCPRLNTSCYYFIELVLKSAHLLEDLRVGWNLASSFILMYVGRPLCLSLTLSPSFFSRSCSIEMPLCLLALFGCWSEEESSQPC